MFFGAKRISVVNPIVFCEEGLLAVVVTTNHVTGSSSTMYPDQHNDSWNVALPTVRTAGCNHTLHHSLMLVLTGGQQV